MAENRYAVICGGKQQLEKISLGNHGDLHKLIPVDAHNLLDRVSYFFRFGQYSAVRIGQLCNRFLRRKTFPMSSRLFLLGGTLYFIGFSVIGESQFNLGGCFRLCIFRTEHGGISVVSARFAVQRISDCIKNACFPRARDSSDKVQPVRAERIHIQFHSVCIGAECG